MSKDVIYRQDAVDAINELHDKPNAWLDLAVEALEKLPSAQSERKKGHWLHEEIVSSNSERGYFLLPECTCSECNSMISHEAKYCPNCGSYNGGERGDSV